MAILETIITWCYFFINFSLVDIFIFSHSWFIVYSYTSNSYTTYTWQDYLTYSPSLSYYIIHPLLTIYGSCGQYKAIPVLLIHGIRECVAGIFCQVTIHDSIQDSVIIDHDLYLEGRCYLYRYINLRNVRSWPEWGGTFPGTFWYHRRR